MPKLRYSRKIFPLNKRIKFNELSFGATLEIVLQGISCIRVADESAHVTYL